MRKAVFCLIGLVAGYAIGALAGYAGVEAFSANTHDKSLEAAMTAAFFTGPIGAVLGLITGCIIERKRKT